MKSISNLFFSRIVISLFLGSILCAILILAINSTLSCVDNNGCLRSWCKFEWLKVEYQIAVSKQNKVCPFQNNTGLLSFTQTNIDRFIKGTDENNY